LLDKFTFTRLSPDSKLKSFSCGDSDLDEFFLNDCRSYMRQLLAVTYTFESKNETAAFFSVLNDKIINKDSRGKTITNKIIRKIPNKKRRPTYPAVKIGRLAVNTKYQRNEPLSGLKAGVSGLWHNLAHGLPCCSLIYRFTISSLT